MDKKAIEKLFILTRGMVKICLLSTDDEFRKIAFKEPITNKVMKNHSIRTEDVPSEGSCRVLCYMDPDCVSINLGPFIQGKHTCQLNNTTEKSLANEQGFTYYAIEVTSTFVYLFGLFCGDVIMTTLVISLMVPYSGNSGTCFVLYLPLIRTLVIAAHV